MRVGTHSCTWTGHDNTCICNLILVAVLTGLNVCMQECVCVFVFVLTRMTESESVCDCEGN